MTDATALLQGETWLKLDINAIDPRRALAPLHFFSDHPKLTDLLLRHGARPDIRCKGCLPLDSAIGHLSVAAKFGLHDDGASAG
ncbi:hypothetical protein V6N13_080699 [Hibiscus sabdariffa]|uniref:Uncharacterized protein n=2 Tax=Hibiscus sabdariffa TaxID=183260 RepID=A0ABR2CB06_9ROSI